MSDDRKDALLEKPTEKLEGLNTYIDGKMKRYSLLFTVNGGAFAIAKLLGERNAEYVVGDLTLEAVAIGAVIFTCLMWLDIYLFGEMMRSEFFRGDQSIKEGVVEAMIRRLRGKKGNEDEPLVFGPQGKLILGALCTLLNLGWLLAAFGPTWAWMALIVGVAPLLPGLFKETDSSQRSAVNSDRRADRR